MDESALMLGHKSNIGKFVVLTILTSFCTGSDFLFQLIHTHSLWMICSQCKDSMDHQGFFLIKLFMQDVRSFIQFRGNACSHKMQILNA